MRTDTSSDEFAVKVLDITQDGEMSTVGDSTTPMQRWASVAVLVALAAGLLYGFFLGRGDRPADLADEVRSTTSTTAQPITSTGTVAGLDSSPTSFRRSVPDHDLGRGVTEYLDLSMVSTIAVDDGGWVWAAGPAGVVRLDPHTGELHRLTDSDGSGPLDVRDLAVGQNGSVYAVTGRGLSHWDGFEWATDSLLVETMPAWEDEPGPVRNVGHAAVAPDGTVWLVTHEWSGWTSRSYVHHDSAPFSGEVPTRELPGHITDLVVGPDETVWALADEGLWRYDGAWTKLQYQAWMSAMAVDAAGTVWVGREGRIVGIGGDTGRESAAIWWSEALEFDGEPYRPAGVITHLAAAPNGLLWAVARVWDATDSSEGGSALLTLEDGALSTVPLPEAIEDQWIEDLAVAPNGDLWIAVGARLMRFDGAEWVEFSISSGPAVGSVGSMTVGPVGDLWLAGDDGITRFTQDWTTFERSELHGDDSRPYGDVWVTSSGEQIWAGVGCHAAAYGADGWEPLPAIPDETTRCWHVVVTSGPDDSLWVAAMRPQGGAADVYQWNGDRWAVAGWVDLEVSDTAIGPNGTLWLAGWDGLGRFGNGEWAPLVSGQSFEHVFVADDGTAWATTGGLNSSGVWRLREGVWEIDLGGDTTTVALAGHPDGSVWTLQRTRSGGYVAHSSEGGSRFIVDSGELHTMTIGPDGTIWAAGEGRLYRVAPVDSEDTGLTPMDWMIRLDDDRQGIHTIHMRVNVRGIAPSQISNTSGRLFWDETGVELCRIGVDLHDGFVEIGDIFQTTEGCGSNPTAMQEAVDEFGLPRDACVFVHLEDGTLPVSYCAPLPIAGEPPP